MSGGVLLALVEGVLSPSRVWRNRGDGTFEDVSAASGFDPLGYLVGGLTLVEYNQDGRLDVHVSMWTLETKATPIGLPPVGHWAGSTPNFPSYPSGHSTQSAAAALVLGTFFPADAERLRAMALEAAESRILGGIRYRHDNVAGIEMGLRIGALAVERLAGG